MRNFACIVLFSFCVALCGCFRTPEDDFKGLFAQVSEDNTKIFEFNPEKKVVAIFRVPVFGWEMDMIPVVATLLKENTLGIYTYMGIFILKRLDGGGMAVSVVRDDIPEEYVARHATGGRVDEAAAKDILEEAMNGEAETLGKMRRVSKKAGEFETLFNSFQAYNGTWVEKDDPERKILRIDAKKYDCKFYDDQFSRYYGAEVAPVSLYRAFLYKNGEKEGTIEFGGRGSIRTSAHAGPLWQSEIYIDGKKRIFGSGKDKVSAEIALEMSPEERKLREAETQEEIRKAEEMKKAREAELREQERKRKEAEKAAAARKAEEERIAAEKARLEREEKRSRLSSFMFAGLGLAESPMDVIGQSRDNYDIGTTFPVKQSGSEIKKLRSSQPSNLEVYSQISPSLNDFFKFHENLDRYSSSLAANIVRYDLAPPRDYEKKSGIGLNAMLLREKGTDERDATEIMIYFYTLPGEEPKMLSYEVTGPVLKDARDVFIERYGEPEALVKARYEQMVWRSPTEAAILTMSDSNARAGKLLVISQKGYEEFYGEENRLKREKKRLEEERIEKEKARREARKARI